MEESIHYEAPPRADWQDSSARERTRAALLRARQWFDHRVGYAIRAGLFGALSVVVFFFLYDLIQGRPFWTPAALGSSVFLGEPLAAGAGIPWALVLGYTVLHAVVFIAIGLLASLAVPPVLRLREHMSTTAAGLVFSAALFTVLHVFFLIFDAVMLDSQAGELGAISVALANLVAACVIAFDLLGSGARIADRAPEASPPASDA